MRNIRGIYDPPPRHWVGDGFPVRSLFNYNSHGAQVSPFLLLDHAAPMAFDPAERPRGVGEHPHRGFETVTIVYAGEVEHRDSTGAGGTIGPGDVQWMTAGRGIVHDEFHSPEFTRNGGVMEMVQLWVNLPADHKMTDPGYQTLRDIDIPRVELPEDAGKVRVIAGAFDARHGPAKTHTPMNVWDLRLNRNRLARLGLPDGWNALLVVLHGTLLVNNTKAVGEGRLVVLAPSGGDVLLEASSDAVVLVLSGQPINEPVVGHGPFVMNTAEQIHQAIRDYSTGRFGRLQSTA